MTERTRFDLSPGPAAHRVVQHHAVDRGGRDAAVAAAAPGNAGAGRPDRSWRRCSRGADHAGGLDRPVDRHPRRGARHLPAVEALAAVPRRRGWSRRSRRRRTSTSSTRASRPAGSHKPNTAIAQAYYNKEAGTKRIATETGAGQWGSALAMACTFFGIDCQVFMVRASYEQKPYRRIFMETFGAEVTAVAVVDHAGGQGDPRGRPDLDRLARHRDQRGRRGRGDHQRRTDEVLARLGAEPRHVAPDDHRARGQGADGAGRRARPTS